MRNFHKVIICELRDFIIYNGGTGSDTYATNFTLRVLQRHYIYYELTNILMMAFVLC